MRFAYGSNYIDRKDKSNKRVRQDTELVLNRKIIKTIGRFTFSGVVDKTLRLAMNSFITR